jgi:cob(I)alamin adenosyltransferase
MLATGERILKSNVRIEAYGNVDELNSMVGFLRDSMASHHRLSDLCEPLLKIQNELFDVGGELSVPLDVLDPERQQVVSMEDVARLEREMDVFNESLKPLENFVLPGGHLVNSTAHIVRTVCRRAERAVVRMSEQDAVRDEVRIYLNRLSDWLFVLSREISRRLDVPEVLWAQNKKK